MIAEPRQASNTERQRRQSRLAACRALGENQIEAPSHLNGMWVLDVVNHPLLEPIVVELFVDISVGVDKSRRSLVIVFPRLIRHTGVNCSPIALSFESFATSPGSPCWI